MDVCLCADAGGGHHGIGWNVPGSVAPADAVGPIAEIRRHSHARPVSEAGETFSSPGKSRSRSRCCSPPRALTKSLVRLLDVPLGFSAERVWTASIQLPDRESDSRHSPSWFFQTLVGRISALPGVEAASAGHVPFNPSGTTVVDLHFRGRPLAPVHPAAAVHAVLPNYFTTLRIPLLKGHTFSDQDGAASTPAAVVDRAFADDYFAGDDAIGKFVARDAAPEKMYEIVGVVGNVAIGEIGQPPQPQMYVSALQDGQSATYLIVREAPGQDVTATVRQQLREMDPDVALFDVETMADRVSRSVRLRRFVAGLLNIFAAMGLLIAAVGLYGTLAHAVQLRRREIAIRLALGAHSASIRGRIALRGVLVASAGLLPGMVLGIGAGRMTRSFLFGTGPLDTRTVAITLLGFVLLTVLASWIPTARAARIDALAALRDE